MASTEIQNQRMEQVAQGARKLVDAAVQAQDWIAKNEERVVACGKSKDKVLGSLRQQTRLLRRLERAARRKMCAGVFGPSQAGKSYLLSSLAANDEKKVPCKFGSKEYDFLKDLNPGGSKESTGLVTRFTLTEPAGITDAFPVHVRLLSETELVKIFANSYFCDCEHKEGISDERAEAIRKLLTELKGRAGKNNHITLDDMEDLREYIHNSFGGVAQAADLNRIYWDEAIDLASRLELRDRARLFGVIWGDIAKFTELFEQYAQDLEKLGNPEEAFMAMDALVPREASIIDVETLGKTNFSDVPNAGATIRVRTPAGIETDISRKNATALVAELTLVMKNSPAVYFDHTDLLDFPGYKARLECSDIVAYMDKGKEDSRVEQFFRRGKVAYLFQRYNAERELTSLLLCVAAPDNTPGLPGAIEEWIISTHGLTPETRRGSKNALFYILTKSDRHFEQKGGANPETHWNDVLRGMFIDHFSGAHSLKTKWVDEWEPGVPFNNLYMLRNINIKWSGMMNYEKVGNTEKETGIRAEMKDYADNMQKYFLDSALVKKHFRSPATAFDEVMKFNDGGIGYIKRSLEPLCEPELKLGQIATALTDTRQNLLSILEPFHHSGNQEVEQKKKMQLFGNFGKLFANPNFQERFPEMLNSFKIPPDQLFYMYADAERQYDDYRENAFAHIPEPEENAASSDDAVMPDLDSVLDIFNTPEPAAASPGAPAETGQKDEAHFYAKCIIDAWSANMRSKAESSENATYYLFPKTIFMGMLDEFDQAVGRLDLCGRMEQKFRELAAPVDVPKESKIRKQASYAIGVLNDFVSWMGKNPAEIPESARRVKYNGEDVTVFRNKPPVDTYPKLAETFTPFVREWYKDWLRTFYGMLMDNVSYTGGSNINIEENARLGRILETVNEART